jgi:hypothetical protein
VRKSIVPNSRSIASGRQIFAPIAKYARNNFDDAVTLAGIVDPGRRKIDKMKATWFGFSVALLLINIIGMPASPMPATTFESGEVQNSLIELFTSEGCSSCPPAEKWISALKSNQDLWKKTVPVAFHVDYWDRLGWRDRFAKPEFTSRQQHYAAGLGRRFGLYAGLCRERQGMARLVWR